MNLVRLGGVLTSLASGGFIVADAAARVARAAAERHA